MKQVIACINNYVLNHPIAIYEDGNLVDSTVVDIKEVYNTLQEVINKYQPDDVLIQGSPTYAEHLMNKLQEKNPQVNYQYIK